MPNVLDLMRSKFDLDNWSQAREAAGVFFLVAHRAYDGRLATTFMSASKPYNWVPEMDGRSAKAKELKAAEEELFKALSRYDKARLAAFAK